MGQTKWVVTPYRVEIWTAAEQHGAISDDVLERINRELRQQVDTYVGAAWVTSVRTSSPEVLTAIRCGNFAASAEQLLGALEKPTPDKFLLVQISKSVNGYIVSAREFDVSSELWGPTVKRDALHEAHISKAAMLAVSAAFAPLVQLGSTEGKNISGRLRAAELIVQSDSPALVQKGDLMLPVLRRSNRFSSSKSASIERIPWTVLSVVDCDDSAITSEVHSAGKRGLAAKASLRVQRLGIAWPIVEQSTRLKLQTLGGPEHPLADYEILESTDGKTPNHLLGVTDWQGAIEVARTEEPLRILYVKSGTRLVAKLPMVPSWQDEMVAVLADDQPRVLAEAMVEKLKQEIIDTTARRELISARIRSRIIAGQFAEAQALMNEYRKLSTRRDFTRRLEAARGNFKSDNPRVQAQVDQLFTETVAALGKLLDPDAADRLEQQIATARNTK